MQITEELARFVSETPAGSLPAAARETARRAILDTLGVMLVGSREDCARIVADVVRSEQSRPTSTVVGQGFRTSVRGAALANGVSAHALDYDDVNSVMTGHPSVPLLPAVLAVGEETGASGEDALAAFVLGFEVEAKLGRAMGRSHYARGFHATATLGALAAASAAARLYGLEADHLQMALGIAASLAGGLRQNFGTMTKPLHPGYAAQNGIVAAQLAARGFTADANILEGEIGYLNVFSPDRDAHPERITSDLGGQFEILESGVGVKQYPCCFGTHRALDATLDMRSEHGVQAGDVERVEVVIPRGAGEPLIHSRPVTGLQGKFSMEYCVAAAILDGKVGLDSFEDESVRRPAAQELLRKVETLNDASESAPAEGFADVTIYLNGGRLLKRRVDEPRGSARLPLRLDQLQAKYRDCAERVLGPQATQRSLELVLDLERLPSIAALTEVLLVGAGVR